MQPVGSRNRLYQTGGRCTAAQQPLEELKGWTSRPDDSAWAEVPVFALNKMPDTVDGRSAYADESVVTYTTDADYTPVMPYETVKVVPKAGWKLIDVKDGKSRWKSLSPS